MKTWLGVLIVVATGCQPLAQASEAPVAAAWQRHEIEFVYMGFTTRYSCDGLRDKMKLLLRTLGARPGFEVATQACSSRPSRVDAFPHVRLVFEAPQVVQAGGGSAGEPTVARWRPVTLAQYKPRELEKGDCELVEQFRNRVLRAFVTRRLEGDINCIPHQLTGSRFDLHFDVLEGAAPGAADGAAGR